MKAALVLAFAAAVIVARPAPAAAEEPPSPAMTYGVVSLEVATAAVFTIAFGTDLYEHDATVYVNTFGTLALGTGSALFAHRFDLDPRPALALHGAIWVGGDLFLMGTLVDGLADDDRLAIGPTALVLGGLGAIAGGLAGATQIETQRQLGPFLAGPSVGLVAGGLGLGGLLVLIGGIDGDKAMSQFTTGAVVGVTTGLAIAGYLVYTDRPRKRLAPPVRTMVVPGRDRLVVSFAGTF